MNINKVVMNTEDGENVLIDLTSDTVTPGSLAKGVTAHNAAGEEIVGTIDPHYTVTTTGTGAAYEAEVDGITELTAGVRFVMIPHITSTSGSPTLNVNGLGAKIIRRRISNSSTTTTAGSTDDWIAESKPLKMLFDGVFWIVDDLQRPNAQDLYGRVPVASGGVPISAEVDSGKILTVQEGSAVWNNLASMMSYDVIDEYINVYDRRNTPRGINLGTSLTSEQKANIVNGIYKGFFIGDYWSIGGFDWRIVDMGYWMFTGDTTCVTPHLVIMPDTPLYNASMNDTNTTAGGYMGSKMYTTNLANAKTKINQAFGAGNILTHRELLTNAVTNGYASAGAWVDSTVELPDEIMIYGSNIMSPASSGTVIPYNYSINKSQLSLFKLQHNFINHTRQNYWLRNVVSASSFAFVDYVGIATYAGASGALGVRPVFGITGNS